MSEPANDTNMVAEGIARLTSMYRTKPNIIAIAKAVLTQKQGIQAALYASYVARRLRTATLYTPPETNSVLDVLGALVGQRRLGLSDTQYQAIIFLRVAVDKATGQPSNWAGFANILLQTSGGGVEFYEGTASFFFFVGDLTLPPEIVAQVLADAVPNGIRGVFGYSTWPDGNDFEWCDVNDPTHTGQGTWGDSSNPAIGGLLISALEMV